MPKKRTISFSREGKAGPASYAGETAAKTFFGISEASQRRIKEATTRVSFNKAADTEERRQK